MSFAFSIRLGISLHWRTRDCVLLIMRCFSPFYIPTRFFLAIRWKISSRWAKRICCLQSFALEPAMPGIFYLVHEHNYVFDHGVNLQCTGKQKQPGMYLCHLQDEKLNLPLRQAGLPQECDAERSSFYISTVHTSFDSSTACMPQSLRWVCSVTKNMKNNLNRERRSLHPNNKDGPPKGCA